MSCWFLVLFPRRRESGFCFASARHFSERWNPAFVWLVIPAEAGIQGLCALARHSSGSWNPAFALAFDSF
jgi:hypothetical protein